MDKFKLVKNGETLDIRSQEGDKIATITDVKSFRNFQNGYVAVEFITKRYCDNDKPCECKWGFVDTKGNIVVEPKYIYVSNVNSHGNAYVELIQFEGEVIKVGE